jgi:chromosome partitioning protein
MSNEAGIVGVSEIAELAGFTRQAILNWRTRYEDFPQPLAELKSGPIWQLSEVIKWASAHDIALRNSGLDQKKASGKQHAKGRCVTVAIVNMKGGVGKSTITANLGWYCAYRKNQRVLLVDLDPQFNLSQYVLGSVRYEEHLKEHKKTILDIFEQGTPEAVTGRSRPLLNPEDVVVTARNWQDGSTLDIIPSRLELAWTLTNPHDKEHLLDSFLRKISYSYDLVLIDCAPTESMLTKAAYMASDYVLVPVKPEFLSTIGLPLLVRSLSDFHKNHEEKTVQMLGILFNSISDVKTEHQRSKEFVSKVANENDWYIFRHEISYSDSYPTGARDGKPIFLTDYARSWKVAEFKAVAEEFLQRVRPKYES